MNLNQDDERREAHTFAQMWDSLLEGRSITDDPGGPALLDTLQVVRAREVSAIDLTPNPTFVRQLEATLRTEGSRLKQAQLTPPRMDQVNRFHATSPGHTHPFEQRPGRAWGRWSAVAVLLMLVMISGGTLMKSRFITSPPHDSRSAETTVAGAIITSPVPTQSGTTAAGSAFSVDAFFDISGFPIDGNAMAPTLQDGNFALVDRTAYQNQSIARWDIVIFDPPVDTDWLYIFRVIGLPNETIEIRDDVVYVNGQPLDEPYTYRKTECINRQDIMQDSCGPWVLSDNEVFVLGDNRRNSADSRIYGAVTIDWIVGKVLGESTFFTP